MHRVLAVRQLADRQRTEIDRVRSSLVSDAEQKRTLVAERKAAITQKPLEARLKRQVFMQKHV